MIKWILRKMIARLDKDIKQYRRERLGQLQCAISYSALGGMYAHEKREHEENAEAIKDNIQWCTVWRNRMARHIGDKTVMAWQTN